MKKLVLFLVTLVTVFALSGCTLLDDYATKDQTYTKEEVDAIVQESINEFENDLQDDFDYIQEQIEKNENGEYTLFLEYVLEKSEELLFVTTDEVYNYTVESYGYSPTYIFKVEEPCTIKIKVSVDNDLDLDVYTDWWGYGIETYTITPSLLGFSRTFTFEVTDDYFIFEFESWDTVNESTVDFVVSIEEGDSGA